MMLTVFFAGLDCFCFDDVTGLYLFASWPKIFGRSWGLLCADLELLLLGGDDVGGGLGGAHVQSGSHA
jgi:hypothetical protein